jgi:uncharacterized protein
MILREMSNEECRDMLARVEYGRLATVHQNQPYIVPIYFAYDREYLYGFTTLGRKVEWMRANPLVCVEADDIVSHFHWSSVVVLGHYEELPDTPMYRDARLQAQVRLEKRALWWQTAYAAGQVRGGVPSSQCAFLSHTHRRDHRPQDYSRSCGVGGWTLECSAPGAREIAGAAPRNLAERCNGVLGKLKYRWRCPGSRLFVKVIWQQGTLICPTDQLRRREA